MAKCMGDAFVSMAITPFSFVYLVSNFRRWDFEGYTSINFSIP